MQEATGLPDRSERKPGVRQVRTHLTAAAPHSCSRCARWHMQPDCTPAATRTAQITWTASAMSFTALSARPRVSVPCELGAIRA